MKVNIVLIYYKLDQEPIFSLFTSYKDAFSIVYKHILSLVNSLILSYLVGTYKRTRVIRSVGPGQY